MLDNSKPRDHIASAALPEGDAYRKELLSLILKGKGSYALDLSERGYEELPPEIGELEGLVHLNLSGNQLRRLPREIGNLRSLRSLLLARNKLEELPTEVAKLTELRNLDVSSNRLRTLPADLFTLRKLLQLRVDDNQLQTLPRFLGYLQDLEIFSFSQNQLMSPPPSVLGLGLRGILAYFKGQIESSTTGWVCKLLVVGEGGVGKTCLLRALREDKFQHMPTTHGIEVRSLHVKHPTLTNVNIQLNAWDFGGQHIYHATHQFFLTNRSLFVVVWNARLGFEQGRLYYWLDIVKALAPESPVLLVATHTDERDATLPIAELRHKYPIVVDHLNVSSSTGEGIQVLREAIANYAARLPDMGLAWPVTWLRAAERLALLDNNSVTPPELFSIMDRSGVIDSDRRILATWLHRLGDILFYQDDPELNDVIILRPDWVTQIISRVLESQEVIDRVGIFTRQNMEHLWADLDRGTQDHLLRLMERFDLSYRTLENRDISIIVERLSLNPPDYAAIWESLPGMPIISMKFQFKSTLPPGLPTWFIARSHRFTTYTHWRFGALFADGPERRHLSLVTSSPHDRTITLQVKGPSPQNFFALLRDGLELTIRRFPGLLVQRTIPCPGHYGHSCTHEFDLSNLERALERFGPDAQIQCPVTFESVSVLGMLFGIDWQTRDTVLTELRALRSESVQQNTKLDELLTLTHREFLALNRRDRDESVSRCPSVFVVRPRQGQGTLQTLVGTWNRNAANEWWDNVLGQELELQLFCEQPGSWHPTRSGGLYTLRNWSAWLKPLCGYMEKLITILRIAAPLPQLSDAAHLKDLFGAIKDELKLMDEIVKQLKSTTDGDVGITTESIAEMSGQPLTSVGAEARVLCKLLEQLDPQRRWGGLTRALTPEGHYLWLCDEHAAEYRM